MAKVNELILDKTDLDLNTSAALPEGDNKQGATAGSMAYATAADLDQGFVAADKFDPDHPDFTGDGLQDTDRRPDPTVPPFNGFLGRPQGWQR